MSSKGLSIYLPVLIVFVLGICVIIRLGQNLTSHTSAAPNPVLETPPLAGPGVEPLDSLIANLRQNLQDPLTRLFVQLILIVAVARICGTLARQIGQAAVIGEMAAGILLGPSLLGWVWPGFFHFVFPATSLGVLRMLSQIGVCLFMFVVGMELDLSQLKHQARTAFLVSQVSILFPYLLGVGSSLFLYSTLAAPNATFQAFALFIGISMSITAFPVLARILEERNLTKTALGSTAIACAASDDVTAWTVLAFVIAIVKAGGLSASFLSVGLVVMFVLFMLFWIKPRMPLWIGDERLAEGSLGKGMTATILVFLFTSALVTEVMGIHALFGAFLAGIVMPSHGQFREFLKIRLEHFSSLFLLPLFFAFTGLRTQIGLLNDAGGWFICIALILIATVGKLGGAMLTARATGINWVDSFALGALMNTRGLVELIALNIGYDLRILSPRIFTMLVIMALVTTCMTGPLLSFGDYLRSRRVLAVKPA